MRLTFKTETTRANATTVSDLYTIPGSKRWRRNVVVSSPQRVDFTAANSTTSVVTLMPPAVEPGQPPMNIKNDVRSFAPSVSCLMLTEAKPAVRVLTD